MYLNIARKYRPQTFSEVLGQDVTIRILKNSMSMDRVMSGMIISGTRGTGKTTLARIYAKALNCENLDSNGDPCRVCPSCRDSENDTHPDIVEFDAASNNGVDFIRGLDNTVSRMKTYNRKVFIFDEAHMFTPAAQAAFLKLLEEPPEDTTFVLVTTDRSRLIDTVRSRCLSMPLQAIKMSDMEVSIRHILDKEGVKYEGSFIQDLSLLGDGSMRDVQQFLDQMIIASGDVPLKSELLSDFFGILSITLYKKIAQLLCLWDLKTCLITLEEWYKNGVDLRKAYLEGFPNLLRDLTLFLNGFTGEEVPFLSGIMYETFNDRLMVDGVSRLNISHVKYLTDCWKEYESTMYSTFHPRVVWSLFFSKAFGGDL